MSVRWRWEPGEIGDSATVPAEELPLRQALTANPELRVIGVCGYFDLICSPASNAWVRDQLPPDQRTRVTSVGYAGGHATYLDDRARARIRVDVFRFFGWDR